MPHDQRILITGAGGFVGRHLIARLLKEERFADAGLTAGLHSLSSLRAVSALEGWDGLSVPGKIERAVVDLTDAERLRQTVTALRPTHIVHLASRSSGADTDRAGIYDVNVEGTRRLLDAAGELSPFPKTLVISTGYVYGDTNPLRPAREEDPIGPLWKYGPYTDSKIEMEQVAKNYAAFALIVRPFAHTGAGHAPAFALPSFARQLAQIERGELSPVIKVGNLQAEREMLHVADVVNAYLTLLSAGTPGEIYNVASGKPSSMQEMLNLLRSYCRVSTALETDPSRMRAADIACSTGDAQHLHLQTGWTPQQTLETTLQELLDYWRGVNF